MHVAECMEIYSVMASKVNGDRTLGIMVFTTHDVNMTDPSLPPQFSDGNL